VTVSISCIALCYLITAQRDGEEEYRIVFRPFRLVAERASVIFVVSVHYLSAHVGAGVTGRYFVKFYVRDFI
jgi:hypothetical protein